MTTTTLSSSAETATVSAAPTQLLINGSWRGAAGGRTFPVDDPSTGTPLTKVADATPGDATDALAAAHAAQSGWASTSPRARSELLRSVYEQMIDDVEQLALLMTLEMGKSLAESRAEVRYAAEFLRWFSEEAVRVDGRYAVAPDGDGRLLTLRQHVGPCLLITPWNFPLAMGTRKIGPALAAGCTVVVKPAQQTPLSMLKLAELFTQAGLPRGVLNVVPTSHSSALVAPLLSDARLRKLSFTGSTDVGRALIAASADQVLRVSMELGGNAPFLVFADADLDAAVEGAIAAKLRNIGQACTAANRFLIEQPVAEEFAARLADRFATFRIGRGVDPGVDLGPLIDAPARDRVHALVQEARADGARVHTGGEIPSGPGHFYPPTVIDDVSPRARLVSEEIFGPVAPITVFQDDTDALTQANATAHGLAAYVYTRDLSRALRLVEGIDAGMVGLNQGTVSNPAAPFGGIKHSGFGREGGHEGIDEYLETKFAAIAPLRPPI